jgi:hypothetical protein
MNTAAAWLVRKKNPPPRNGQAYGKRGGSGNLLPVGRRPKRNDLDFFRQKSVTFFKLMGLTLQI